MVVSQKPVGRAVIPAAVVFQTVRQVAVAATSDAGPAIHTLPAQHVRSCHGLPTAWCARQWTTLTEWMFRRAVWNPSDPACLSQVMPIITPAYPADNSAFNVSDANLKLMKEEIRLARASVRVACGYVCGYVCGLGFRSRHSGASHTAGLQIDAIVTSRSAGGDGSDPATAGPSWSTLFEALPFFRHYTAYVPVLQGDAGFCTRGMTHLVAASWCQLCGCGSVGS